MRLGWSTAVLAVAVIVSVAMVTPGLAPAGEVPMVSRYKALAPIRHGNLEVFPVVTAASHDTQAFLTLDEGLRSGDVVVSEAGNIAPLIRPRHKDVNPLPRIGGGAQVNQLMLVNNSKRPLILLAGAGLLWLLAGLFASLLNRRTIAPLPLAVGSGGGFDGEGISPATTILRLWTLVSAIGTADRSASV